MTPFFRHLLGCTIYYSDCPDRKIAVILAGKISSPEEMIAFARAGGRIRVIEFSC